MEASLCRDELFDLYDSMDDEDVVEYARNRNGAAEEHLINKHKNFVRAKARSYFLVGADREDIIQEGRSGFIRRSETSVRINWRPLEPSQNCALLDRSSQRSRPPRGRNTFHSTLMFHSISPFSTRILTGLFWMFCQFRRSQTQKSL